MEKVATEISTSVVLRSEFLSYVSTLSALIGD